MSDTHHLFPTSVYRDRIERAQQLIREVGLSGLLIGTGPELAYLTGSWISTHERLTALVITDGAPPSFIYPAVDRGELAASAIPELDITEVGWVDGDNPHEIVASTLQSKGSVGVSSGLTADHLIPLQELVGGPTVLASSVLSSLFMTKDDAEIEQLRRAGQAIDRVHDRVPSLLRAGRTEREVATDLRALILKEHDVVDFIIVGSGPNGANPHHSYSDRILETGDVVVVDIGGTIGPGYHSDCTRTYVVGGSTERIDARVTELYRTLTLAQLAAIDAVRPGVSTASIDAAARDVITAAGYGEHFIHRTGHGIGLSTHEEPFIMAGNDLLLEPGMAFSIEPGIYLEGIVGARIEDIVVVTEGGCELLNNQPKDLR